jgi:hypothetical protein
MTYHGEADVPFYRIGDLARALNRSPGTIHKWEAVGILPRATFGMKVAEGGTRRWRADVFGRAATTSRAATCGCSDLQYVLQKLRRSPAR